jgi:hypothetical protein
VTVRRKGAPRADHFRKSGGARAGVWELQPKGREAELEALGNGVLIHDQVHVLVDDTGQGLPGDPAQPGPVLLQ